MINLFNYNWMVRDECFELCKQIPFEELLSLRVGGVGSIVYTLFHIIDVEYSWIRGIQGKPDIQIQFIETESVEGVQKFSDNCRDEIQEFLASLKSDDKEIVSVPWSDGYYTKHEVLHHLVSHEIHHMGQLSIWVRELGLESISVSTLCREAVVNRGTFYLHFKDIGALFDEHLHYLLKDLEDSYYEPYRHVSHLIPSHLDPSTIRIFHHVKIYQLFYEIVFDKKSSLSYYYSLLEKIKSLMHDSTSVNQLRDIDVSLLVAYQANAIMGLLIQWGEEGFARSPEYMNEQLTYFLKMHEQKSSSE